MRVIQCFFILLLTGLISNCGFVQTAYNNAPQALSWWLDDYFDFTQSQQSALSPALNRLHDWHRQNQLPLYIATLKDLQSSVSKAQISTGEVCKKTENIKALFGELQLASIPIIVVIAPLLSDKQLQYFQTKLDKRAQKWKSEWWQDTPEAQIEMRLEKIESFSEKLYGDLSESQQTLLKQNLTKTPINPALSYAEILRRNTDAYDIVYALNKQAISPESKENLVKAGFDRLKNSPNPEYQAYANQIKQRTCEIIADLHASTNAKQKQHANDWLEGYITEFTRLSTVK
ncbi:MAG: hypothetical protein CTY10_07985 [Methylotenera sp.]|nr:MAG: hypothetical protein CTY10_07985 [Methylotenera sp.]